MKIAVLPWFMPIQTGMVGRRYSESNNATKYTAGSWQDAGKGKLV